MCLKDPIDQKFDRSYHTYRERSFAALRTESLMARLGLIPAALTISVLACGIGFPVDANAKVTKLEITSKQSYGVFRPGEFVFWEGRVIGELRPTEAIPDIDKIGRASCR